MTGSEKYGHALPLDFRSGQLAVMRADYRKRNDFMVSMWHAWSVPPPLFGSCRILYHLINIAAQVLNAFLLPLVIGFLVALAVKALPESLRPRGFYLWALIAISAIVIAVGLFGGVSGLL